MLLQRYTFWSNSQLYYRPCQRNDSCLCYYKDTHFEAIHNEPKVEKTDKKVVYATTKIHILKQFTTLEREAIVLNLLFMLLQRYTFWSNSQPSRFWMREEERCLCYYKDTHFEAIHNQGLGYYSRARVVYATTKIHILKQFTTLFVDCISTSMLFMLLQRYTFWSNSQLFGTVNLVESGCLCYYKDTHFEAIHN